MTVAYTGKCPTLEAKLAHMPPLRRGDVMDHQPWLDSGVASSLSSHVAVPGWTCTLVPTVVERLATAQLGDRATCRHQTTCGQVVLVLCDELAVLCATWLTQSGAMWLD